MKTLREVKENWDSLNGPTQLAMFVVGVNVLFVIGCWVLSPLWR